MVPAPPDGVFVHRDVRGAGLRKDRLKTFDISVVFLKKSSIFHLAGRTETR